MGAADTIRRLVDRRCAAARRTAWRTANEHAAAVHERHAYAWEVYCPACGLVCHALAVDAARFAAAHEDRGCVVVVTPQPIHRPPT